MVGAGVLFYLLSIYIWQGVKEREPGGMRSFGNEVDRAGECHEPVLVCRNESRPPLVFVIFFEGGGGWVWEKGVKEAVAQ